MTPRVKKYLTGTSSFDHAAWRAWQIHWFTTGLQIVEQRLAMEPVTGTVRGVGGICQSCSAATGGCASSKLKLDPYGTRAEAGGVRYHTGRVI